MNIRPPAFAGQFYPEDETELRKQITDFLDAAKPDKPKGAIRALISPHAGYIYSGSVAAFGYKLIKDAGFNKVLLIGPSHQMMFTGIALTNFSIWKTPLGLTSYSKKLTEELTTNSPFQLLNEVHAFEHSLEVQLPFLQSVLDIFTIVPMITGRIDNLKDIAKAITKSLDDETIFIVSTDLSHYLPYEKAQVQDKLTIEKIEHLDATIDHEHACGADGVNILIEVAKLHNWRPTILDYRNSGDTAGDKKGVVGYVSVVFTSN